MRFVIALYLCLIPAIGFTEVIRIASYHAELSRDGPGILLDDIVQRSPQVMAVVETIRAAKADVIVLQGVDYDHDLLTAHALRDLIDPDYQHIFTRPPNRGQPIAVDINGDSQIALPHDAHSYGDFPGKGGLLILSRYPFQMGAVQDFTALRWADVASPETPREALFERPEIWDVLRLSTTSHWAVPITVNGTTLTLLTCHATPPVFDGPEDRNGWRNHDETVFWVRYLDGDFGPAPPADFVFVGVLNIDRKVGEGRREALDKLLGDPRLQDSHARSPDGGDHTVRWPKAGPMRVSYILPSTSFTRVNAGQQPHDPKASRHRLIWADIDLSK